MNSFRFFLSGKRFICPSILNYSFAGQSNLGCRFLLFMTLNVSCQCLLPCKVSFEKSTVSLMGTPLQETNCFSLAAFKIVSLSLTLGILIMMSWNGPLCIHLIWDSLFFLDFLVYFLHQIGEVFFLFFQIDFQLLALSLLLLALLLCKCWTS